MKTRNVLLLLIFASSLIITRSAAANYLQHRDFALASAGGFGVGLYGYDNPAVLNYLHQPDMMFTWQDTTGRVFQLENWALFLGVPKFSFGVTRQENPLGSVLDYRLSTAFGGRKTGFGIGYGWSAGDTDIFDRTSVLSVGSLFRPNKYLSFGLSGLFALNRGNDEGTAELAIRPLGSELITFFGDYNAQEGLALDQGFWSAGIVLEPAAGLRVTGRYLDDQSFNIGVNISLGRAGFFYQGHYSESADLTRGVYGIRSGAYDRSLLKSMVSKRKKYLKLDFHGRLQYQRYVLFDRTKTLKDALINIEAAKNDPAVAGIAINCSGMKIDQEMLWEIRDRLSDFRGAGKRVVIYIDNAGFFEYYLASVADRIVMDPLGLIDLRGLTAGRTYLKGTLEKLGIGFDEWRFLKYKSAAEILSMDRMSDADREQRQEIITDIYSLVRSDITYSRKFGSKDYFDDLVNKTGFFTAKTALEKKLVDTLGRWDAVKETIKELERGRKALISAGDLCGYNLPPDNVWGERPKIAIVYGLGVCAMDEGITARQLVKDVEAVAKDKGIKAVVFRVDSPGGDALASDIVAEAIKQCTEKKPVVVSQGLVAGSGGYWLSMYGDKIVASPVTITGSIGVIGGWMYDTGLKDKLGVTTDKVQVGEHADLGFGAVLPFIGALVPDRNLTEDERDHMKTEIIGMYEEFVRKVADGRGKTYDQIEAVAQGRVWSGSDGRIVGLVDTLGGLDLAIKIARDMAGIDKKADINIVEYPKRKMLNPEILKPKLLSLDSRAGAMIDMIEFYLEHNGRPLPLMPIEYVDMTTE